MVVIAPRFMRGELEKIKAVEFMKKADRLEKLFNKVFAFPVWCFRKGRKYILQDVATGNIIEEFGNYTIAEERYLELEERQKELEKQWQYFSND